MPKGQVFYRFHFKNDIMRAQQLRIIGAIEDNKPVTVNHWGQIRRSGEEAIKKWTGDNMRYRSCCIVLIGGEAADSKWVKYEIKKAWEAGKGLLGIYIHNINYRIYGKCNKGGNLFGQCFNEDGKRKTTLIKRCNPNPNNDLGDIVTSLEGWVADAVENRSN